MLTDGRDANEVIIGAGSINIVGEGERSVESHSTRDQIIVVSRKDALVKTALLGLPITLAQIIPTAGGFIGAVMLSHVGYDALAANTLIVATQSTVIAVTGAPFFYINTEVGELDKRGKKTEIGRFVQQAWMLSALSSGVSLSLLLNIKPILRALSQQNDIVNIVGEYFKAYAWGIPAVQLQTVSQQYAFATKNLGLPLSVGLSGLALFSGASYVLIFGKLGFSALGVAGLGYASALRSWVNLAHFHLRLLCDSKAKQEHHIFSWYNEKKMESFLKLLKKGSPIIFNMASEYGALFFSTMLIGHLGKPQLAAEQVISQYQSILYSVIIALSLTNNINISRSFGEQVNIRRYAGAGLALTSTLSLSFLLFSSSFPRNFAAPFIHDEYQDKEKVLGLLGSLFPIAGAALTFDAVRTVSSASARGVRDMFIPMLINLASVWLIAVPLAYVLGMSLDGGILGVNGGIGLGFLVGCLALLGRLYSKTTPSAINELVARADGLVGEVNVVPVHDLPEIAATDTRERGVFFPRAQRTADLEELLLPVRQRQNDRCVLM
ncbi:MAG: MATE family efflux transporter [Gammaproteobacteria bacterium]|nr:MATE family efflux transporter [Gammaproteobacteria bacterium]